MIGSKQYPCKTESEIKFAMKGKKNITIVAYGDIQLSQETINKLNRRKIAIFPIKKEEQNDNKAIKADK